MDVQIGKHYLTKDKEIVEIDYTTTEKCWVRENVYLKSDIVAEIPKPLMYEIARITQQYHTDRSFKTIINHVYGTRLENNKGNENGM